MPDTKIRQPLEDQELVVHVAKGSGPNVRIVEMDSAALPNEITVQVSRKRKPSVKPLLGVIVK